MRHRTRGIVSEQIEKTQQICLALHYTKISERGYTKSDTLDGSKLPAFSYANPAAAEMPTQVRVLQLEAAVTGTLHTGGALSVTETRSVGE